MFNRKAITPVIAVALLIVVSVVTVIAFQGWFQTYSSDLFVQTEKGSSSTSNTNIETLVGDQLYFKNTLDDNISIKQIKIGNKECNISLNLTNGVHNISLGNCVKNLTSQVNDITVITDKQIYTKKHLFKDISIVSSSQSLEPVVESQLINNSLLFDGVDDYLSWTPGQEGNRTTWTWSGWVKAPKVSDGNSDPVFAIDVSSNDWTSLDFYGNDLRFNHVVSGTNLALFQMNGVFEDKTEFHNIVIKFDSTQVIAEDRVNIFFDGVLVGENNGTFVLGQDVEAYVNSLNKHVISGGWTSPVGGAQNFMESYFADVYFIDGQALGPENFGELNDFKWIPKKYEGTYGTNGFHLDFSNSSNLGEDSSGNSNENYNHKLSKGDRTGLISVSSDLIIDGTLNQCLDGTYNNEAWFRQYQNINGHYIRFDMGESIEVIEVKQYRSSSAGNDGDWQWQGSNDLSTWVNLTNSVNWGDGTLIEAFDNVSSYRYYQRIGISGQTYVTAIYLQEFEFKIKSGNDFTVNGAPIQTIDTPENNFAVFNSNGVNSNVVISKGNLVSRADISGHWGGKIFDSLSSGKWYFEVENNIYSGTGNFIYGGFCNSSFDFVNTGVTMSNLSLVFGGSTSVHNNGDIHAYAYNLYGNYNSLSTISLDGDILMIAADFDNGKFWVGKNGIWSNDGNPSLNINETSIFNSNLNLVPCISSAASGDLSNRAQATLYNGAQGFTYTPPTGFNPLSSKYIE